MKCYRHEVEMIKDNITGLSSCKKCEILEKRLEDSVEPEIIECGLQSSPTDYLGETMDELYNFDPEEGSYE